MILGGDVLNQKKAKLKCAFTIKQVTSQQKWNLKKQITVTEKTSNSSLHPNASLKWYSTISSISINIF